MMNIKTRLYQLCRRPCSQQQTEQERYLATLPPDLAGDLAAQPCLVQSALDTFCRQWYPASSQGIGQSATTPLGYHYTDGYSYTFVDGIIYPEDAFAITHTFTTEHDSARAIFIPRYRPALSASGLGFTVDFGWGRRHLAQLWPYSSQQIGLVRADLQAGIVIDHYAIGSDITFDVAWWGNATEDA